MAASTYLSLLFTISIFFISHATLPTSNPKLYQNVCKQPGKTDFEQRCLTLIESYPPLTQINDRLTFCRSFVKMVAIEKTTKAQEYVKQMMNKYPSSQPIKECATEKYDTLVNELKAVLNEDPDLIDMDAKYAADALDECETVLAREKIVNVSSIYTLNNNMMLLADIVRITASNL
ncbi:unnamed protein product [Vicia faba]|uniref:Pectinesterase inhibitor domain-containing protein n=1 Tax=Vicia faba TaxID=3906 RepID=A0AAV1AY32_VICFA|nr:unnamed protein product [Vicia faba]